MREIPSADHYPVRTVCGDVAAAALGRAHCHEHTFILPGFKMSTSLAAKATRDPTGNNPQGP